ncbi:Digestive cysteine proteinase 1 [Liparis tanakae]|uniref:Digestive cysteine proteinase 1 n=1 Tax=Liparis tanakae TaxID=230148 RepID=A0A4Z2ELX8_9TELE|nr:Digestive cysteine proteinase 1 [Liparis tanakae]
MKLLIVVAAALAVASCASISLEDLEFHAWKLKFARSYNSGAEELQRKEIWLANRRHVLDGQCRYNPATVSATCTGYVDVEQGDEDALKEAVATIGPVSVTIDADHLSFQLYESGVYDEPACSSSQLDHGVLAVGYGTDNGQDYWLVKNSWGLEWGDTGYIMMTRNKHNQCGIATFAIYPLVQDIPQ